jgi:hypothetical protein
MRAISILRPGGPPERRRLDAPLVLGGSRSDDVQLPDCPPGAIRLVPCGAGVVVEVVTCGARVAGHPVPPGLRRLLRFGESAHLHGTEIVLERPPAEAPTRAQAGALLREAAAGMAPIAGAHLVVLTGPAAGARHPLRAAQTIGRGRAAAIRIPDAHASRVHARIRLGPAGPTVEDLRSKNGVYVNGVRIERRESPLHPGDEVLVGETALAIEDPWPASGAAAVATPEGASPPRGRRPRAHLVAAALLALSATVLALAGGP